MTKEQFHSVRLNAALCKGCTHCIKLCPTQAIRVQNGKAQIIEQRCIDCGVCIRTCPYHAKLAVTDSFDMLKKFEYTIALPAPTLYGQFPKTQDINIILSGLKAMGFDDVFEVAIGAEFVTQKTKELVASGELLTPAISSACPAVVRLITTHFPNLIPNLVPLESPMEAAAKLAREEAAKKTGLDPRKIGVFFISPCAAKATAVKRPMGSSHSNVSAVLSIRDIYLQLSLVLKNCKDIEELSRAGVAGINWANEGGEIDALHEPEAISVDGIEHVVAVLEGIENEKFKNVLYVEALACPGGCVGGPLTVENGFVAKTRIKNMAKKLGREKNEENIEARDIDIFYNEGIVYRSIEQLDEDRSRAMKKMQEMNRIYETLPKLDCGSCGAPTCRALAEDIVRGSAQPTDCIFKLRERVRELAREMVELEETMPPSFETDKEIKENE